MANSFWGNLLGTSKSAGGPPPPDFSGDWITTFGAMSLTQKGANVQGVYGGVCTLEGTIGSDGVLGFRYVEPNATGEGRFVLERPGKFSGQWRQDGMNHWSSWLGQRGFDGIWESTFGPLRLIQGADGVQGFYEGVGSSSISGRMQGNRLVFRYQEPMAQGEGWFELTQGGANFEGQWRPDGGPWGAWKGTRRQPVPGLLWLVVLEAYWQRGLHEKEYAFGNMLREFFARVPNVEVRHRFFNNEEGLARWCRELLYLPEPIALVFATHGTPKGLTAHGELVRPEPLVASLRHADNVQVLHFSSCLMMDGNSEGDFTRVFRKELSFPISGYTTSVDWAASALIEFTYLDLILSRGYQPKDAADQVVNLLAFAGDEKVEGSPFPPACFRFWAPGADEAS